MSKHVDLVVGRLVDSAQHRRVGKGGVGAISDRVALVTNGLLNLTPTETAEFGRWLASYLDTTEMAGRESNESTAPSLGDSSAVRRIVDTPCPCCGRRTRGS